MANHLGMLLFKRCQRHTQVTDTSQTGAIDHVHRATSQATEPEKAEEGKRITKGLAKLKYELQHNRQLT